MENKRTLVIGASSNPARYSYLAVHSLRKHNHDVLALAKRKGQVADKNIQTDFPQNQQIHTVTLYIGPKRQTEYFNSLIELNPNRVIFNPGTKNIEFMEMLETNGIEVIEACTLVLLNTGQY